MPLGGLLPYEQDPGLMGDQLYTPQDKQAAFRNALMAFGNSALSNSGWTDRPTSFGQVLGQAATQGMTAYESGLQQAVKNALLKRQIAKQDKADVQAEQDRERVKRARESASSAVPDNLRGAFVDDPATAAAAAALIPAQSKPSFIKDLKLPDGSTVSGYMSPEGFVPVTNPVAPEPTVDEKKQVLALRTAQDTLNDLKGTFQKTGTEILPTVGKTTLKSQYRNLQLQLKELFNLGVLNGPDLELMNEVLIDPTSASSTILGNDRIVASMDEVQQFIKNKEKALLQSPGVRAREGDSILNKNTGSFQDASDDDLLSVF